MIECSSSFYIIWSIITSFSCITNFNCMRMMKFCVGENKFIEVAQDVILAKSLVMSKVQVKRCLVGVLAADF